jgi:hypothetical protein
MADFYFLFGAYYAVYYICRTMANEKKITVANTPEVKIVRTYRIKETTFLAADAKSKQKYGKGVAAIIEQLIENHFDLNPKKK